MYLLFILVLLGDALAVTAEAVELVDELVDDVPGPVVLAATLAGPCACRDKFPYIWHLEIDRPLGVQDVVEEIAVVVVAGKLCLQRGLELEGGGGSLQLCVDVLVTGDGGHPVQVVHALILRLLPVLVRHQLLLDVRLCAPGRVAMLVLGRSRTHPR